MERLRDRETKFFTFSEYYDPSTNSWTTITSPSPTIGYCSCSVVGGDNKIYIFTTSNILQYDPPTDTWKIVGTVLTDSNCNSCSVLPWNKYQVIIDETERQTDRQSIGEKDPMTE